MPASKAKQMQDASQETSEERRIRITIIDDKAYEYHLNPHESVVRGILDPDIPDAFIEVPIEPHLKGVVVHAYLHTSRIAKFYLHDELMEPIEDTGKRPAAKEAKGGEKFSEYRG